MSRGAKRFFASALVVALVVGGFAVAALVAWPRAAVGADDEALARVTVPRFTGRVVAVRAHAAGRRVPVRVRDGRIWPVAKLDPGERVTIELTVRRPGWAAWLVGGSERRTFA